MESTCTREQQRSARAVVASLRCGPLLTVALVAVLVTVLSVGAFAINNHVIYQRSSGQGNLWAYSVATGTDRPLFGTDKMAKCIIADLDGDGAEDEIIYETGIASTLGYYKISSDGAYHPENDLLIVDLTAPDAIPQAVVRDAATGWGKIVYSSQYYYSSFAAWRYDSTTWLDTPIGPMDKAFAADVRKQGFKGDLFYQIGVRNPDPTLDYFQCFWREGVEGTDYQMPDLTPDHPNYLWEAYGVAKLIPNRPDSMFVFYSNIPHPGGVGNFFAVCDANWNFTVLDGTNGAWGPVAGRQYLHFGQVDDSGLDSILFCNGFGLPLQFYRPGDAGPGEVVYADETTFPCDLCPWDTTHYVNTDPAWPTEVPGRDGCIIKGIATGISLTPLVTIPVEHISQIGALSVGDQVSLTDMMKTLDTVEWNPDTLELETTGFYIQEPSRVAGIRVQANVAPIANGSLVSLTAQIADVGGERVLVVGDPEAFSVTPPETLTFAIHPDGTGRTFVTKNLDGSEFYSFYWPGETGVAAGDVLGTGVKNDLLYVARNGDLIWREGISGPEHLVTSQHETRGPYWPLATGYVLPDKPDNRIFACAGWAWYSSDSNAYSISASGDVAVIWEITSNWGALDITRMDANRVGGTDDVLFYNHALQWSKISWDSVNSRYVHDPNGYWVDLWTIEDTGTPTKFGQYNFGATNGIQRARVVTPSGTTNCIAGKLGPAPYQKSNTAPTLYYVPNDYAYGVWNGPAGTIYRMDESERMFLPRYVDIDGDGMDDIVYHDNDTGEMCWYKMTSEWFGTGSTTIPWNPDNVHKITSYGLPLAVLEPAGEPKQILFYDTVTARPVGAQAKSFYGPGVSLDGLLVTVAGRVIDLDPYDGTFTISDGSPLPLTVACPDPALPADLNGAFVTVTGCVGAEAAGASTIPVIRVPSASYIH